MLPTGKQRYTGKHRDTIGKAPPGIMGNHPGMIPRARLHLLWEGVLAGFLTRDMLWHSGNEVNEETEVARLTIQ